MKTTALTILILIFSMMAYSQKPPIKYGKLSEEEINLEKYGNADAVILCDYGTYSFDGRSGRLFFYFTRHLRIKILSEEGIKFANQSISFYDIKDATYYSYSKGYEFRGQTLNVEKNGKVAKSKYKLKYVEESGSDANYNNTVSMNFKDVGVGSIIEYEIKIPTIEVVNPKPWYLQHEIPVLHSELRIISPEYINYSANSYNVEFMDLSEMNNTSIILSYKRGSMNVQGYIIQFVKKNISAVAENTPKQDRMYIKLMLDHASQRQSIPGITTLFRSVDPEFKYLDKAEKNIALTNAGYILYNAPNLENIPEKLNKNPDFGPPLNLYMEIQDTLINLTKDITDDTEKAWFIYDYISKNMTWNGTYRYYVKPAFPKLVINLVNKFTSEGTSLNRSLNKPFETQSGTNAEINFILINALRKTGFKAYPVLTATMDFAVLDPQFFNLHQFNHVLVAVEVDNNTLIMDASLLDGRPLYVQKNMNKFGLLIKRDEAFWIDINGIDLPE